jgi:hypothetical protein
MDFFIYGFSYIKYIISMDFFIKRYNITQMLHRCNLIPPLCVCIESEGIFIEVLFLKIIKEWLLLYRVWFRYMSCIDIRKLYICVQV